MLVDLDPTTNPLHDHLETVENCEMRWIERLRESILQFLKWVFSSRKGSGIQFFVDDLYD